MKVIDVKAIVAARQEELKVRVTKIREAGITPKLVIVQVGSNPASNSYIRSKLRAAENVGIEAEHLVLDARITEETLVQKLVELNNDTSVHGYIVQLPLPPHISEDNITDVVSKEKDVDGFHPEHVGNLVLGKACIQACTPKGIIDIIKQQTDMEGKHVVVIGRSNIVGKPVAMLALNESATVTMTHSKTKDLKAMCRQADILIVAVGRAKFVTAEYVKRGAIIIDVGINYNEAGKLCGDVDTEALIDVDCQVTPVPGGVGPMTVMSLMTNTLEQVERGIR